MGRRAQDNASSSISYVAALLAKIETLEQIIKLHNERDILQDAIAAQLRANVQRLEECVGTAAKNIETIKLK